MGAGAGGATGSPPPGRRGSGGGGPLASDAGGAIDPPSAGGAAPHKQRGPAVEAEPGQRRSGWPQGQPADGGLHEAGRPSAPEVRRPEALCRLAASGSEAGSGTSHPVRGDHDPERGEDVPGALALPRSQGRAGPGGVGLSRLA